VWFDDKTLNASAGFIPKAGTALETFTKTGKGKRPSFAKRVPKTAFAAGAMNIDTRALDAVMAVFNKATIDSYKQFADLRPEDIASMQTQLDIITKNSPGDAAFGVYVDGDFPGAMMAVTRVVDINVHNAGWAAIVNVFVERALAKLKADGVDNIPPPIANAKNLGELVTAINGMGAALGVKMTLVEFDPKNPVPNEDGVMISGLRMNVDWARFAAATQLDQADPELFKTLSKVLGGNFEMMSVMKDDLVALAFGPNATKVATALVTEAPFGGGESGLNRLADNNVGVWTFRLDTVLKAIAFVPKLAAKRDLIKKIPTDRPLTFTYETDGTATTFSVNVPLDVMHAVGVVQD
jgi:hypothetical protein